MRVRAQGGAAEVLDDVGNGEDILLHFMSLIIGFRGQIWDFG